MNNPSFISHHTRESRPILVVDKTGIIGPLLAKKLSENYIVVLVTPKYSENVKNIVHIPFAKKIPAIPDNVYSYIFVFEDSDTTHLSMPSFIKKANLDQSRIVLLESLRKSDQRSVEEIKFYKIASVVFYGDLFDEENIFSIVGKLLREIKKSRTFKIEGEGTGNAFPVYTFEFLDLLIEQIFVRQNSSKVINFYQKNPTTFLGLAKNISAIDPLIKIDFIPKKEAIEKVNYYDGDFVIEDNYDFKSKIKEVLEKELPKDFDESEPFSQVIEEKKYLKGGIILLFVFAVFFLFLPLFTTLFYSFLGLSQLDSFKNYASRGDLTSALKSANSSKTFFIFASKTMEPLKSEAKFLRQEKRLNYLQGRIELGQSVSEASIDLVTSSKNIQDIFLGKSQNPSEDFDSSLSLMKSSIYEFRKIEAQKDDYPEIEKKISEIDPFVNLLSNSIDILPNLLGFKKEMKYLVLFQNNMELRPGGGFIGSYALLSIKNGQVKDFKINNVYNADGQLKGHIDPPMPIRKYLPQPHLYLRDSNFDTNFLNDASQAAYLLNLETGDRVDGVMALDIDFVKKIISATGPIKLPDYNVTVDSSNLFQLTEEHSQKDFFAGSTQKEDFLSSLFKAMEFSLGNKKDLSYLSLVKSVSDSLVQKHILLASIDPKTQSAFSVNNWSSENLITPSVSSNDFEDILGVSEANLGINKVNFFISRSMSKAQIIDDQGQLSSTVSISYRNDSTNLSYKNYIRFILPLGISIDGISFDNITQQIEPAVLSSDIYERPGYKAPLGLEVDQEVVNGKTEVGFLVNVMPKSVKTISITYKSSQVLSLDEEIKYNLKIYKQPGIEEIPFDFSFYFPSTYQPIKKAGDSTIDDGKVSLSTKVDSDSSFEFDFGKK